MNLFWWYVIWCPCTLAWSGLTHHLKESYLPPQAPSLALCSYWKPWTYDVRNSTNTFELYLYVWFIKLCEKHSDTEQYGCFQLWKGTTLVWTWAATPRTTGTRKSSPWWTRSSPWMPFSSQVSNQSRLLGPSSSKARTETTITGAEADASPAIEDKVLLLLPMLICPQAVP